MFVSPLLIAGALASTQPSATPAPVSPADPQTIVQSLQSEGYRAQLDKDEVGDPMIVSAANGGNFYILFYGCTKNKDCRTLQFRAGYDTTDDKRVSVEAITEFNSKFRFAKAYFDKEHDPIIELDLAIGSTPMPHANFAETLNQWSSAMGDFQKHIGW